MPYFDSESEAYEYLAGVFRKAAEHPQVGPALAGANLTLQLRHTEPDIVVTVQMR